MVQMKEAVNRVVLHTSSCGHINEANGRHISELTLI